MKRKNKTKQQQNTTCKRSTELISITYDYVSPGYTVIMYAGNILPNEVHYAVDMLREYTCNCICCNKNYDCGLKTFLHHPL